MNSSILDNYLCFARHDAEQEALLDKLPRCCECDQPIQQEDAVYINDEWICDDCLSSYRREVNPYE